MGTCRRDIQALSTVVGTVLMLAISVAVIGGLSFVVAEEFSETDRGAPADLRVLARDGQVVLEHRGGPRVPTTDVTVLVNVLGSQERHALSDLTKPGDPAVWVLGEPICLAGPDASCLHPSRAVQGAAVATPTRLLVESGERGDPAASPDWRPDLEVAQAHVQPTDAVKGESVQLSATIENTGFDAATGTLEVDYYVDGSLLGRGQASGPLDGGAQLTATGPTWTVEAGAHTFLAVVDPDDTVDESDESDNEGSTAASFELGRADPGHAYEDVACDGIYEIGADVALTGGELDDGAHATTACLVIPSSMDSLAANSFDLSGDGGVTLRVDLTASTGSIQIASQDVTDAQGVVLTTLAASADIRIDAGTDIHVESSTLETQDNPQAEIVLTGGSTGDAVFVEGARFRTDAGPTVAKAEPSGIQVVGTPAEGSVDNS